MCEDDLEFECGKHLQRHWPQLRFFFPSGCQVASRCDKQAMCLWTPDPKRSAKEQPPKAGGPGLASLRGFLQTGFRELWSQCG